MPAPDDDAYDDAVQRLFAREPTRMVPDLERITLLCDLLDRPECDYPAIQITGTNGKTTTARMVTCLLGALGLTAGTYTSPHLQDVRERIRIASEPISRDDVVYQLEYLEPFLAEVEKRCRETVTFFELLTALAFTAFADAPVDVGVFEVGMGGRWDATNVVDSQVAVFTRVALDHPELGATVAAVADEKAGIVKEGAMVVSAAQAPDAMRVIERAVAANAARLVVAGRDFGVAERRLAVGGQQLRLRGVTGEVADVYLPLHGAHQADNAAVALAAVEGFLGFKGELDPEIVRTGFAAVASPGRLEVVRRNGAAPVVLDGAHNPAGMASLAATLRDEFAFRSRVVVVGMLGDKNVEAMLATLLPLADHVVVTQPASARAAPADRLAKAVRAAGRSVEVAGDVAEALELACGLASPPDAVVVTGSLYTVGAARDALGLPAA